MSVDTVRVFISSPYRDMQAERAYLHDVVFPRVSEIFQQNGHTLEFVDPRRLAVNEDEAEGLDTLERALDDVEACRPHFLCLLGSNYGKVTLEVPDAIGRKHPAVRHFFRTSRVHLESLTGVIRDPSRAPHAYFYFRNPDFLTQVDASEQSTFVPNNKLGALNEIEAHKLEIFKEAVRNSGRPVFEYGCSWDSATSQITGLEEFGARVENDLLCIIGLGEPPMAAAAVADTVPGSVATEEVAAGVLVAGAALAGMAVAGSAHAAQAEPADGGWETMATEEIAAAGEVASVEPDAGAFTDDAAMDQAVAEVTAEPEEAAEMSDDETVVSEEPGVEEAAAEEAAGEVLSDDGFDAAAPPEPAFNNEAVNEADAEAAAAGIFGGDEEVPAGEAAEENPFEVDAPLASDDDQPADIVSVEDVAEEEEAPGEVAEEDEEEEEAPKKKAKKGGWFGLGKKKK
jgi:hypothetical protein